MNRLSSLFEEDIAMQDALEDIETLTDDSEDIIISNIEHRYNDIFDNETHLFTNENTSYNEDGLSMNEESRVLVHILDEEQDIKYILGDDDADINSDDLEEFLDDDLL